MQVNFGRIELVDERDALFPAAPLLAAAPTPTPTITEQFWWDDSVWLNQGQSPMCTVYSHLHWLHDGPVIQEMNQIPIYDPRTLYNKFQANDGVPGVGYQGTTVRAGAKVLQQLGFIKEYRWVEDLQDIVKALLVFGPMVAGTRWWTDMNNPGADGMLKATGKMAGGHAYVLNGVDTNRELIRMKNSWGRGWGDQGHGYITFDDMDKLLKDHGEVYIGLENKMDHIPDLNSIPDNDSK